MGRIEISFIDKQTGLPYSLPKPTKLIVNGPATVILWDDGSKTVAKCNKDEPFDPEKGVAIAIAKRFVSSNKLHMMFDGALSQINDSDNNPLNTWLESIRAATASFVTSAGGEKNERREIQSCRPLAQVGIQEQQDRWCGQKLL